MGSDNGVDEPYPIDPLQGEQERFLNAFSKGVEEIIEALNLPVGEDIPSFDGFFEYRDSVLKTHKGEINQDPSWWREQIVRDWVTIQSRVRLQMAQDRSRQFGEEIATNPFVEGNRINSLRVITFEQFVLESNAGQFREDHFYCDKGRKWLKNVRIAMEQYGYTHIQKVDLDGLQYLEVSKNPL